MLLTACGGGGSSGESTGSDEIYDLDAAITAAYATGFRAENLRATSGGDTYELDFELRKLDDVVIDGTSHKAVRHLSVVTSTAGSQTLASEEFYTTAPFRSAVTIGTNSYLVHSAQSALPSNARPGSQVTPVSQAIVYANRSNAESRTNPLGLSNLFWRLDRVTATTAYLCLINTYSEPATAQAVLKSSNEECLLLDRTKAFEIVDARVTLNGIRFE